MKETPQRRVVPQSGFLPEDTVHDDVDTDAALDTNPSAEGFAPAPAEECIASKLPQSQLSMP